MHAQPSIFGIWHHLLSQPNIWKVSLYRHHRQPTSHCRFGKLKYRKKFCEMILNSAIKSRARSGPTATMYVCYLGRSFIWLRWKFENERLAFSSQCSCSSKLNFLKVVLTLNTNYSKLSMSNNLVTCVFYFNQIIHYLSTRCFLMFIAKQNYT